MSYPQKNKIRHDTTFNNYHIMLVLYIGFFRGTIKVSWISN